MTFTEIEQLARECEEWNGKHQIACMEIERLRAALKEIADLRYDNTSAATIARAALDEAGK